ncbi:MAG: EamA family transporter RarD [Proteobacteria bacterium]|nr:EamA family transporter RarD [Pseudomonadota bacterium]
MSTPRSPSNGIWLALGAYSWWGLVPIYFRALRPLSPLAVVGWRIVLSVPILLALVAVTRQGAALRRALTSLATIRVLALSTVLIAVNWLVYVYAISQNHVYAASIGYYLNPLVNIALGTLFLGEKLRPRQWVAVGLGAMAALILLAGAADTLAVSVSLAISFSLYGMLRKLAPVESLPGLTVETLLLALPSAWLLDWLARHGAPPAFGVSAERDMLIAIAGLVTAVPLLMFAAAARRMDFSTLGFCQYLSPSLTLLVGLLLFHEPMRPAQIAAFAVIWVAVGVFTWDALAARRAANA